MVNRNGTCKSIVKVRTPRSQSTSGTKQANSEAGYQCRKGKERGPPSSPSNLWYEEVKLATNLKRQSTKCVVEALRLHANLRDALFVAMGDATLGVDPTSIGILIFGCPVVAVRTLAGPV